MGTGNSDAETRALNDRLGPHLRKGPRPDWVVATGDSSEKPHLWMDEARFSVVMQVKADVRPIRSKVFATSHSLRFPRVMAIRWDKPWRDVLTQAELREQVQAALGQGGDARDGCGAFGGYSREARAPTRQNIFWGIGSIRRQRLDQQRELGCLAVLERWIASPVCCEGKGFW